MNAEGLYSTEDAISRAIPLSSAERGGWHKCTCSDYREKKESSLQAWFVLLWLLIPFCAKRQQRCHSDIGWPKLEILWTTIPWEKCCHRNAERPNKKKILWNVNTVSSAWKVETVLVLLLQCTLYCVFSDFVPRLFHSLTLTVHNPSTRFSAYSTMTRIFYILLQVIFLSMWSDFEKMGFFCSWFCHVNFCI